MLPNSTLDNLIHERKGNLKTARESLASFTTRNSTAYLHYLGFSKLRVWIQTSALNAPFGLPALGNHISHVVRIRAQEKMFGADTQLGITVMENVQFVRDLSVTQKPRSPVCQYLFRPVTYLPVTTRVNRCSPQPTCRCLFNLDPETLSKC